MGRIRNRATKETVPGSIRFMRSGGVSKSAKDHT